MHARFRRGGSGRARALAIAAGLVLLVVGRAETLTIATYNLENYGLADRMTGDGYRTEYPKPEDQKRALRRVIVALNADILAVQEIGPQPYLDELRRDLKRDGLDYPEAVLMNGPDPDRHVALLAKRKIGWTASHADLRFPYFGGTENVKRGVLEVHLETAAGDLAIFVVHLKSRYSDRPDDPESRERRAGEANAVRELVLRRCPPSAAPRFLVLGDFNDERGSPPLERLLRRGNTTISWLLPVADSRGETWTHVYRKFDRYTRVDHVLLSPALRDAVDRGRGRIFDGDGVRKASDHRPVLVTLVLSAGPR